MKTTIIYSVNGREIGRDTYNKHNRSIKILKDMRHSVQEIRSLNPNVKIAINVVPWTE